MKAGRRAPSQSSRAAIAQTLHLTELLPAAYTALGNVLTRLGETSRAEASLCQSVELAQQLGMASYEQLMATGYLAYNLYGQGRVDEAWQLAEGALWAYTGNRDAYGTFASHRRALQKVVGWF